MSWYNPKSWFRGKGKSTPVSSGRVVSKGGPIAGDTPSGYVSTPPPIPSSGTTTVSYSGGGGGGSPTRTVTPPSGPSPQQQAMAQQQARQRAIREAQARQEALRQARARQQAIRDEQARQQQIIQAKYAGQGTRVTPTTADTSRQIHPPGTTSPPPPTQEKKSFVRRVLGSGLVGFSGSQYVFNEKRREEATQFLNKGKTNFVFSRDNPFIGVGVGGNTIFSRQDISRVLQKGGTTGKVADIILPGSVFDIALTGATAGVYSVSGPAIRTGISGYIGYSGLKQAISSDLPKEQRIAGGIIGGLGAIGVAFEVYPYVKGVFSRVSTKYKPVVSEGKVQTIKNVKGTQDLNLYDIALIKEGSKQTGNIPAYKSTAYGFSKSYQKAYIGKRGNVVTSARDLIKIQNRAFKKKIKIDPGVEGYGLFGTPFDLKTGATQTRASRFGISSIKDLFKFNKDQKISFKLTKESPQMVVFEQAKITSTGKGGTFKAVGKASTELEVTGFGSIINVKKVGVTSLYGQAVDIFSAKLGGGKSSTSLQLSKTGLNLKSSVPGSQQVSGYGSFGLVSASSLTSPTSSDFSKAISPSVSPVVSTSIPYSPSPRSPPPSISYVPYVSSTPRSPPPPPSVPHIPSIPSPPKSPPSTPRVPKSPSIPPYRPPRYNPPGKPLTHPKPFYKGVSLPKLPRRRYSVFGRRFGKWKHIGFGRTPLKAFRKGQSFAKRTLGRSFYVPGAKPLKLPGFKRKKEKKKLIYIQKPGKGVTSTLGSRGEKAEIKFFRGLKKPKSKKKKKRKGGIFEW